MQLNNGYSLKHFYWRHSDRLRLWLYHAFEQEISRFALWRPVFLGIGILFFFQANLAFDTRWIGIGLSLLAITYLVLAYKDWVPFIRLGLGFIILAIFGFYLADFRNRIVEAPILQKPLNHTNISGTVIDIEPYESRYRLLLSGLSIGDLATTEVPAKIRITFPQAHMVEGLNIGDQVSFKGSTKAPPLPAVPDTYDFARAAWFKQIGGIGYSTSKLVLLDDVREVSAWQIITSSLSNFRYSVTQRYLADSQYIQDERLLGLRAALVTGQRSQINTDTYDMIRDAGLAHLLAISGLHLGLIAVLVFGGLRLFLSLFPRIALNYNIKKYAAFFAIWVCFGYMLLSGITIPSQRAFLMISVAFLAVMLDRNVVSLRLVAFAALVVLLLHPEAILSASFQLSFAAVTALVCVYETNYMKELYVKLQQNYLKRIMGYFLLLSLTTLVATMATAPLSAYHFGQFASYGILGNLIAVPLMGMLVMPSALIAFLLMPFGLEAIGLYGMDIGLSIILGVADWVANLEGAVTAIPQINDAVIAVVVIAGLWLCLWRSAIRFLAVPMTLLGVGIFYHPIEKELLIPAEEKVLGSKLAPNDIYVTETHRYQFIQEQWKDRWAVRDFKPFSELKREIEYLPIGMNEGLCSEQGCRYFFEGRLIFVTTKQTIAQEACRVPNALIIFPTGFANCLKNDVRVIDKGDLYRNGGYSIALAGNKIDIESVLENRSNYPWQQARK